MNRYVPSLALAAACIIFFSPGRAAAEPLSPSNRTPEIPEPASNWILLRSPEAGSNPDAAKQPDSTLSFWCHKTDCDLNEKGNGKNIVRMTNRIYRSGVPVYTLIPKTAEGVNLPFFRAVPAPWSVTVDQRSGIRFYRGMKAGWMKEEPDWQTLKPVENAALASGQVVVDDDEAQETGKPLPQSLVDEGATCAKDGFEQYFGANDQGKADRFFLPIEFELENARLSIDGHRARIHSGKYLDQPFSTMAESVKDGNSMLFAGKFIDAMRLEIRTAARLYDNQAANGPAAEFSPFEQRFLHCRMGFVGAADDFMARALASQKDTTTFVKSWRDFVRGEVKHYLDEQPMPPGPKDDWEAYSSKADWDEMVARTNQWLKDGHLTAAPAAQAAVEEKPKVQSRPVAEHRSEASRKQPALEKTEQPLQDWLNQQ